MKCEKKQDYYLTNFTMYNERIDVHSLVIDKVWITAYNHFRTLVHTMDKNNVIDFDSLGLKKDWTDKVRTKLHKAWFIRKIKVTDEIWYTWYMNPYLANKSNKQNNKLMEVFKKNEYKSPKWDTYADDIMNILF
jgi:hypothetical protein